MLTHDSKSFSLFLLTLLCSCVNGFTQGFTDATNQAGLFYTQQQNIIYTSEEAIMTGGAAAGDFDGDGWIDLFVTRLNKTDILFRNTGGDNPGQPVAFENVSESAGITTVAYTNGAAWADIDNDGDLDLYVTALRSDRFFLYINNGNGTFTENAVAHGADLTSPTEHSGFSVAMGDFNKDGWIDLHTNEWGIEENVDGIENHSVLLQNKGANNPGHFTNVTLSAGVSMEPGPSTTGTKRIYSFSSRFTDLDGDGWPDLAVASDFRTSKLFWNNGNGTFSDGTIQANVSLENNGMGSTVGDFNGDGLLDWFVTSVSDSKLYRNTGNRTFAETAENSGVIDGGWGWGTEFFDYDNDGDLDLIMTNGFEDYAHSIDPKFGEFFAQDETRLWRNDFGDFTDVSETLGVDDILHGKALLTFDYDRDGDLDVFIANTASRPILYRNDNQNTNKWLRVSLIGTNSNPHGLGAKLTLTSNNVEQFREMSGGSSFLAQSEMTVHFGLNNLEDTIDSLRIEWPDGTIQTHENLSPNQHLKFTDLLTFESWKKLQLTLAQQNDPLTGDPTADPDMDQLSNLFEYFADTDPLKANASPIRGTIVTAEPETFTFSYYRPNLRNGITVVYESSPDLETWTTLGNSSSGLESLTAINSREEAVAVGIDYDPESGESLFVRLRVEATE